MFARYATPRHSAQRERPWLIQGGKGAAQNMITHRPSDARGRARGIPWLDSRHTFSFSDYYDPDHMGFRALRVINEDRVAPREGFGLHPHRDMEILSYVLSGELTHKDNMGNSGVIRPGELQRMSAGTGVVHGELNTADEPVHFLQIWILPEQRGLPPSYEQRAFPEVERRGKFRLLASRDGSGGSMQVHQDVRLYATLLEPGEATRLPLDATRHAWVQVTRGTVDVNGLTLEEGDGAALSAESLLEVKALSAAEVLVFDLA